MGFTEVQDCPAMSLGGVNKKTGKANPRTVEGYFLRTREVPDAKKKSGKGYIHEFQTADGNVAVWGKTDFDKKIRGVAPGTMVRVTWTGKTRPTPNGDMQLYTVEQDLENRIAVYAGAEEATETEYEYADESSLYAEETEEDVTPYVHAKAPARPAETPSAEKQAKVLAQLAGLRKAK